MYLETWKDLVIIRDIQEDLLKDLNPRVRFNEKFKAHIATLSYQNLIKLSQHFNCNLQPYFKKGYGQVEGLKSAYAKYQDVIKTVHSVKSDANLPEINYKVPPLGDYQHRGVWFLVASPIAPMFAECGTGKSFMVIMSTVKQIEEGTVPSGKTLVCGKLATLETGWMEDIKKFSDLKASLIYSTSSYKRKQKLIAALEEPADIYITNHDTIRTLKKELAAKEFKKIVVDESTILKSYRGDGLDGGAFGKALCEVAHAATHRVIMSGTPAPNGPEDLWGQFKFLDPYGFIFEPSYRDFKNEFMLEVQYGGLANSFKTYYFDKRKLPTLKSKVDALAYQVKIRDHLHDLPEKTIVKRRVYMSEDQQTHYNAMLSDLSTILNDQFISVDEKLTSLTKLRQITGGFLIDQEGNVQLIESARKLSALDDLMEELGISNETDTKVVIYAQYQWEIKTIEMRYKSYGSVSVYGGNNSQTNLNGIKSFIENPETKVIVLHPRSAAHGITLTVSHYMIFYSISYSAEENYQCIARIERASQKHPMFIYYLLADHYDNSDTDTIDEIIYRVIIQKQRNQASLIDQKTTTSDIVSAFTK